MLYQSWRRICEARPDQIALSESSSGRRWTFTQLDRCIERCGAPSSDFVFPSGHSAEFVMQVLQAWRWDKVLCPVEPGQQTPQLGQVPAGIVHLKSTSASTGVPRLIALTAPQLLADAANIVETMGLRPEWPNLGVVSLAHSYGFSNLVLALLLHGIPLVLVDSALPESLRVAAGKSEASTIAGVPTLWRNWFEAGAIPASVRLAISAGAPLPLDLEKAVLTRHGLKIHNFYGSSECGGIAYDGSDSPRPVAGCVGGPMRNVGVSIAEDGCVEVRGPAVGETYLPEPSPALHDGVFHTSDLGEIKNGVIYLLGRATDQINIAGRKVLPEVIESVLSGHPQVRTCLAFGISGSDRQRGETIVACVAPQGKVTTEELKQYALARLPAWQVPRVWWVVEDLDSNRRGKLSRAEWRKRFLERREPSGPNFSTRRSE